APVIRDGARVLIVGGADPDVAVLVVRLQGAVRSAGRRELPSAVRRRGARASPTSGANGVFCGRSVDLGRASAREIVAVAFAAALVFEGAASIDPADADHRA